MIKKINVDEIEKSGALELVWRVFQEFEAPDYSEEGVQEFKDTINVNSIKKRLLNNELLCWGYFDGTTIQGVIATYSPCHIALLFVDKNIIVKVQQETCIEQYLIFIKQIVPV